MGLKRVKTVIIFWRDGMSPPADVDPVHGFEYCDLIAQLLQYPEFSVYDLLNGVAVWSSGTSSGCRRKSGAAPGKLREYLCCGVECSLV